MVHQTQIIKLVGFDRTQEIIMRMKLSEVRLPQGDIIIKLNQPIEYGKYDCCWYGGLIATIICNNNQYTIIADGEIISVLSDKKTGKEIVYVKDKYNDGLFHNKMCGFIKNDAQLYEIIDEKNSEYTLCFLRKNWYEVFLNKSKGVPTDQSYSCDLTNIFDAIANAVEYMALPY